jgi:hypothetical protein
MDELMRNRSKLLLTGLAAAIVMAFAVGSASANRIETSSQSFRAVWSRLTFNDAANVRVECPVTLSGSFHSKTISKVSGSLIGYINSAAVGACTGGEARADTETLPWHIQYNSFTGTLPNIESITLTLVGSKFEITAGGIHCVAGNTQTSPAFGKVLVEPATGRVTGLRALEEHTIPLGGGFSCSFASPGRFEGTASVSEARGAAITVRLVA